jgi:hypothetical protein
MAEVVVERVILVDADGRVTQDRSEAVRGETVREYDDGTVESTVFVITR